MPNQSPFTRWTPKGRRVTRRAGVAIAGGLATLATAGAIVASAAVPALADNIVVFPDRDFLGLEGFEGHVGDTATIEIRRAGQVVGSTTGEVAAGDHAADGLVRKPQELGRLGDGQQAGGDAG